MNHDQAVRMIDNVGIKNQVEHQANLTFDMIKKKIPDMPPEAINSIKEKVDNVHTDMQPAYNSMSRSIENLFTDDEADKILYFLESEAGKKYIELFPEIVDLCDDCIRIQELTLLKEVNMKLTGEIN